jgi:hypothetical protein
VLAKLRAPATLVCTTSLAERHTAFVEAVHAAASVQDVPAELISWENPAQGTAPVPVVNGLEIALTRAFETNGRLSETGFVLTPAV